jgi:dienelactone hydrolase
MRALPIALLLALAAPPNAAVARAAADEAPAGKELELAAADGVRLKATYWPAARPGPGVLLLHMCNSDRSAWAGLGPRLAARGIHALALDYRGYGESGGERFDDFQRQGPIVAGKWPGDVDAAFAALAERAGVGAPYGAAGGSCGVNQAIQAARRHPQIRALALLAGNTDADGEAYLADHPWLPVMAAAARDDPGAVEMTRWVLGFSSNPANRFAEYPDGGHGTEIFEVHDDLEPALAAWFERHLVIRPVEPPEPGSAAAAPRPGPSAALAASLRAPGGVAALRARRAAGEALELPPEGVINALGYQRLAGSDFAAALELFELNAELHPESANVHDSLGDGYAAAGRPAEAAAAARRAIALLPADPAADTPGQKAIRDSALGKLQPAP